MMKRAFTLIELLIVVAIIAILAAIAVPNFLEAQVRAKVSRVKADMRSVATALEAYAVDWNHYSFDFAPDVTFPYYLHPGLSTPITYISNAAKMTDVFSEFKQSGASNQVRYRFRYRAFTEPWMQTIPPWNLPGPGTVGIDYAIETHGSWFLMSKGPDGKTNIAIGFADGNNLLDWNWQLYDPTNGTVSNGDIIRNQKVGDMNPVGYNAYSATYGAF